MSVDNDQYRDVISLVDMYHVYLRQHQVIVHTITSTFLIRQASIEGFVRQMRNSQRIRPKQGFSLRERPSLKAYERRTENGPGVTFHNEEMIGIVMSIFFKKNLSALCWGRCAFPLQVVRFVMSNKQDSKDFENLEKKLSYEDIRFYRSIARSRLRKDNALRKQLELEKKQRQPQAQGWTDWLWGSSPAKYVEEDPAFGGHMTEEQRKQLYEVLDYDEKSALVESLQVPRDSLKTRISAHLKRGSFALKADPHGQPTSVMSIVFDVFQANFIQRPHNFEASVSLNGLRVFDGTTKNSLYPQVVRVKTDNEASDDMPKASASQEAEREIDPFFLVKFENNPLDERADNALTIRMRHMEIIYHRGYVEAVYKFFKPPASQLESVEALLVRSCVVDLSTFDDTILGCRKSDYRRPSQRDTSRSRICASNSQNCGHPRGYERTHYHHS